MHICHICAEISVISVKFITEISIISAIVFTDISIALGSLERLLFYRLNSSWGHISPTISLTGTSCRGSVKDYPNRGEGVVCVCVCVCVCVRNQFSYVGEGRCLKSLDQNKLVLLIKEEKIMMSLSENNTTNYMLKRLQSISNERQTYPLLLQ